MPSCRRELYKYEILNNINFYLSYVEKRVSLLGLRLRLGLWI